MILCICNGTINWHNLFGFGSIAKILNILTFDLAIFILGFYFIIILVKVGQDIQTRILIIACFNSMKLKFKKPVTPVISD